MKLQPLIGYRPNYPRKILRGAALTAAALVAIGGAAGCRAPIPGNLQTEGMVSMPEPTEQELVLDGEISVWEPTDDVELEGYMIPETPASEPMLVGFLLPEPTPDPLELRTDGIVPIEEGPVATPPGETLPVETIPVVPESNGGETDGH